MGEQLGTGQAKESPGASHIEAGRLIAGRYRLRAVIGSGGMARVYLAHDERLGREVALKMLYPQAVNDSQMRLRFAQEARLAAQLTHPNVVRIYDVGDDAGLPFLVMQFIEGETLKSLVAREGPLALPAIVPLVQQIAAALDAAHALGIVHRDVKPDNILLSAARQVAVGDFGIARALAGTGLTSAGTVWGSAAYLAPEVAQGGEATPAADLYALGTVTFELITGVLPFRGDTAAALAVARVTTDPLAPSAVRPGLPSALDAVVLRALQRDPARRQRSCSAFAAELAQMITVPSPAIPLTAGKDKPDLSRERSPAGDALAAGPTLVAERMGHSAQRAAPLAGASVASARPNGAPTQRVTADLAGHSKATQGSVQRRQRRSLQRLTPRRHRRAPLMGLLALCLVGGLAVPRVGSGLHDGLAWLRAVIVTSPAPSASTPGRGSQPRANTAGAETVASLVVARGVGANFTAQAPGGPFSTRLSGVYLIGRWQGGATAPAMVLRWTAPDGHGGSFAGCQPGWRVCYVEIMPLIAGTYHGALVVHGQTALTSAFTVSP